MSWRGLEPTWLGAWTHLSCSHPTNWARLPSFICFAKPETYQTATRYSKTILRCLWCHSKSRRISNTENDRVKSLQDTIVCLQCQLARQCKTKILKEPLDKSQISTVPFLSSCFYNETTLVFPRSKNVIRIVKIWYPKGEHIHTSHLVLNIIYMHSKELKVYNIFFLFMG